MVTAAITYINLKIKENNFGALNKKESFPDKDADMTMDNFHFTQTGKGKIDWEVKAAKARLFKKENKAVLEDIEAVFTTSEGIRLELKGDEGLFNTESHDIYIRKKNNDIKVTSSNGYIMTTDSLSWDNKKRIVATDAQVLIEGKEASIKGRGFRINAVSQELEVLSDVEAVIKK
ncbi:MAG: LPS export ABC transporter periplasmic protein LptC [Nitrospirae bacterium]|nr:LPS export ABC transporter periplasmic protein LptC [Nitrospirota bacterium]